MDELQDTETYVPRNPKSLGILAWIVLCLVLPVVLVAGLAASLAMWKVTGALGIVVFLAPAVVLMVTILSPKSRRVAWVRWGSVIAGLGIPLLVFFTDLPASLFQARFDPVAWKAAAGRESSDRSRLIDDLLASRILDHKSRDAVLELLGPDDASRGPDPRHRYFKEWDSEYRVGSESGLFAMDSEWLVLRFTPDGHVSEYQIVSD